MMQTFNRIIAACFTVLAIAFLPIHAHAAGSGPPPTPIDTVGATAALGALNATAAVAINGQNGAGMELAAGTLIGTITPQNLTGSTWVNTSFLNSDGTTSPNIIFASANPATVRQIQLTGGASQARVIASAYTSGTANAILRATFAVNQGANVLGATPGQHPLGSSTLEVQPASLDPCATQPHLNLPIAFVGNGTSLVLVPGTASKKTYACFAHLFANAGAATADFTLIEGTGTTCQTGTLGVTAGTTSTTGFNITLGTFYGPAGNGGYTVWNTSVNQNDLCIKVFTASTVTGNLIYVQQ